MNILVSYTWLKEFLKTDLSAEDFSRLTTNAGNSVERIHRLADVYKHMVVGVVKSVDKHPNADKLRVAKTDIGSAIVEIVCGGVNLKKGQKVVVALPGAMVKWHGEGELVELKETAIRGVKSFGMICAVEEIGFEKLPHGDHDIWDITKLTRAKAGIPIVEALDLDDAILDIEVTTNRPDCASIVGQAREGSAVTGAKFRWKHPAAPHHSSAPLAVTVSAPDLCPRYQAIAIEGVKVGPSPWWLQARLLLAGHRPINNVVDVTNYVLHELGQPLHAFDASTLEGGQIVVRRAQAGEKIVALDGKDYALTADMLVISDAKKPVAIAGVMGGQATGTTAQTTKIILESATFDQVSVRRTSRALNLASDASKMYEKGLSTESTPAALARAVELILKVAGGTVASAAADARAVPYQPLVFPFSPPRARECIGVDVSDKTMTDILKRLGFGLAKEKKTYHVSVPSWRDHDIEASVDFVEEIARVYGYDKLPSALPSGTLPEAAQDPLLLWERRAKDLLRGAGLTETYAYAFVSPDQLVQAGMHLETAVRLANPLSSDQEYMRPSLVPSMLTTIEANQRAVPDMRLFEIAPTYHPVAGDLPRQHHRLLLAVTGTDGNKAFLAAKGALDRLFGELGVRRHRYERGGDLKTWHPSRSTLVWISDHVHVGTLGEIAPELAKNFGLEPRTVLADIDFEALLPFCSLSRPYHPLPLFPEVKRDLAFVVARTTEYADAEQALLSASPLLNAVELFDVYAGKGIPDGQKSMAVHLSFRTPDRTLTSDDVDTAVHALVKVLEKQFSATIRA